MTYITGSSYSFLIKDNIKVRYIFSPKHRGNLHNDKISKWDITNDLEGNCFIDTMKETYVIDDKGWGFIKEGTTLMSLGRVSIDTVIFNLKLAKFTKDKNHEWHGYPCYPKRKGDKPHKTILKLWRDAKVISKSEMSKISSYQKCNL